ncbi:uroporphyrinogen-III C-methyltransferase [Catenovulum adriaticum]|uniref:Uroporphyrinogen-III C-methyltransferase n=1 Tax=Catenovulum adriaticum TaxID=2984846 RepID=A0ABY7AME2_9ALTE|nr:uroporphyrinogen-III C-methyltransferase [Catenovulum sp. TS8]WAJ70388.1 uroporphyrinogen-III C-methyltransferase [Catenovulum sp. TS8]
MTEQQDDPKKTVELDTETSANTTEAAPKSTPVEKAPAAETKPETTTEATARKTTNKEPNTKKSGSNWVAWVALLIALAVAGFVAWAYWLYWQDTQQQKQPDDNQQQQTQLINSIKSSQQEFNNQLNQKLSTYRSQIEQNLKTQKQDVQKSIEQFSVSQISSHNQAILIDAKYLLTLASRKLHIEQDKAGTIAVLKLAQAKLAEQNSNSQWFNLKNQISDDVARVQTLDEAELDNIFFSLTELIRQVMHLPLNQANLPEEVENPVEDRAPTEDISMSNLKIIWHDFLELFMPKQRSGEVEPLLTPKQAQNIRQNLISKLNQAQWAALHQKQSIYQLALQQSGNWIQQFYQQENADVQKVIDQLAKLQNKQLTQDFSTLELKSLGVVENLINTSAQSSQLNNKVTP